MLDEQCLEDIQKPCTDCIRLKLTILNLENKLRRMRMKYELGHVVKLKESGRFVEIGTVNITKLGRTYTSEGEDNITFTCDDVESRWVKFTSRAKGTGSEHADAMGG